VVRAAWKKTVQGSFFVSPPLDEIVEVDYADVISDVNLHLKRLILILPQIFASCPAKSKRLLEINSEREAQPANLSNIKVFKILQIMLPSQAAIGTK